MSKVIQISILGKISGNVNADEVIGNRITMKKMYTSNGEVLPYVSARAIRFAIRQALSERPGLEIDPFRRDLKATEQLRLMDSGNPKKYVDNDLFGYMVTTGSAAFKRYSPIAISYFKALRDTPIRSEFAARFPRENDHESDPVPFEVEIAEFIGRLNVLVYDYIGDYTKSTTYDPKILEEDSIDPKETHQEQPIPPLTELKNEEPQERCKRLSAFLQILLTPSYVLPRRASSFNIPEYLGALVCRSEVGPLPIYQYLDYTNIENGKISINTNQLGNLITKTDIKRKIDNGKLSLAFIDYNDTLSQKDKKTISSLGIQTENVELTKIIKDSCVFLFGVCTCGLPVTR